MPPAATPDHILRPHLRPIQPIPMQKDGKTLVALRDPAMLSQQTMVVPPQVLQVLQLFRGERSVSDIAEQVNGSSDQLLELARRLDDLGLLWGPTFERLEAAAKDRVAAQGAFPATASTSMGRTEAECRKAMDGYFKQTEDPELDGRVFGIVAPHLDYQRGWPNYAAAYYPLRGMEQPDRVIILGTNHFGLGDGVIVAEYGFDSPMGRCPADEPVVSRLVEKLGRPLVIDQLDHMPEHSIQLQLPWLQYCFGNVPVVAALVPDPLAPMIADDGERVKLMPFVTALRDVLDELGGRTLFVASSDLSHVGPQFGEPRPVDDRRRLDVERHDRDMMAKYLAGDAEEFLAAMRWTRNPTRWCSIGNMTAALLLARPEHLELIDYRQAYDDQGIAMVTSAAMAFG
jgi:hypothetical protein